MHRRFLSFWKVVAIFTLALFRLHIAEARTYQVKSGDSLWTIARKFDTHVAILCKVNHLTEKSRLQLGQSLQIPGTSGAPSGPPRYIGAPQVKGKVGYVNAPKASVRVSPGTSSKRIAAASQGVSLRIVSEQSAAGANWYQVRFANGRAGWMRSDLITVGENISSAGPKAESHNAPPRKSSGKIVGFVSGHVVNIRKSASTGAPRVGRATEGSYVRVLGRSGDWYKIKSTNGATGWVMASLLTTQKTHHVARVRLGRGPRAYPVKDGVNLRSGPGRDHDRVAKVTKGMPLKVCAKRGDWYKVRASDGSSGWIAGFLVKTTDYTVHHASFAVHRVRRFGHHFGRRVGETFVRQMHGMNSIVRNALAYRGMRYSRGSSYPSRGFDCSGLVYHVLHNNGVSVPRTSRDQYHVGKSVPRGNLKPGDLVFFKNTYRHGVSHVGIYVGEGKFVHAANRRKGVTVTNLDNGYYRKKFAGARRVK